MLEGMITSIQDDKFSARILLVLFIVEIFLFVFYFHRSYEVIDTFLDIRELWVLNLIAFMLAIIVISVPVLFYFAISINTADVSSDQKLTILIVRLFTVICNLAAISYEILITQSLFELNSGNVFSNLSSSGVGYYLAYCLAIMVACFHQVVSFFTYNRIAAIMREKTTQKVGTTDVST